MENDVRLVSTSDLLALEQLLCAPNDPAREPADPVLAQSTRLKAAELLSSEIHNRGLINWRRVRSAIEHENTLVNHRVTWLLLSQAALLAAFASLYAKWLELSGGSSGTLVDSYIPVPLSLVAILGLVICFNLRVSLRNAATQLNRLTKWWYAIPFQLLEEKKKDEAHEAYDDAHKSHPPLHLNHEMEWRLTGARRERWRALFAIEVLPLYFVGSWLILLFGVILRHVMRDDWSQATAIATQMFPVVMGLLAVGATFVAGLAWGRRSLKARGGSTTKPSDRA